MEFPKQRLLLALALACLPATAFGQDPYYVESAPAVSPEPLSSWLEPGEVLVEPPAGVTLQLPNSAPAPPPAFPTATLSGFFHADAAWFAQDGPSLATFGDIQDFTDFRRARLAAKGKVAENIAYMCEFDFGFPGRPTFMDVYGEFLDLPGLGTVRIGQWRAPMSMDALTSVKELSFLERNSSFAAFLPFRQMGIGAFNTYFDEQGTWAVSGYRVPTNAFGTEVGDSGYGLSGRLTFAPLLDTANNRVLHTGVGYSFNNPGTSSIRFRSTPEIGVTAGDFSANPIVVPFFVDTNDVATSRYSLFNAELARAWGPALMQSEVYYASVDTLAGGTVNFSGAYAQASYVLTGEARPYNTKQAVFERVRLIKDSHGRTRPAWEVAARWSYINLNDGPVQGGQLNDITCGLNCYLSKNAKLQFNYIRAFQRQPGIGDTNTDLAATRLQIDF